MRLRAVPLILLMITGCGRKGPGDFRVESAPARLAADGFSEAKFVVRASKPVPATFYSLLTEGSQRALLLGAGARGDKVELRIRAGVQPGPVKVTLRADGFRPITIPLELTPDYTDADNDGTPDVLRLHDESDRLAFTKWFTFLAESQYFVPKPRPDVIDCAALLRFAYREALHDHLAPWAASLDLDSVPPLPNVRKYRYPYTLLDASLFRIKPGVFHSTDIADGTFAQFADAGTLMRRNAWFVSRDLHRAAPGDLLFYRQVEQNQPFHAMIFLGRSQFEPGEQPFVVYHTGRLGETAGEIRRPSVNELLHHPSPRWRPEPGNSNFLGVFRWNILRDTI